MQQCRCDRVQEYNTVNGNTTTETGQKNESEASRRPAWFQKFQRAGLRDPIDVKPNGGGILEEERDMQDGRSRTGLVETATPPPLVPANIGDAEADAEFGPESAPSGDAGDAGSASIPAWTARMRCCPRHKTAGYRHWRRRQFSKELWMMGQATERSRAINNSQDHQQMVASRKEVERRWRQKTDVVARAKEEAVPVMCTCLLFRPRYPNPISILLISTNFGEAIVRKPWRYRMQPPQGFDAQ
ncbi:hypothetical protein B0H14DRAFT_2561894 [Mycena olivaceomarginata]|nr:hypothetical protein B0H14DRAFT_2561894 [Mycena olivaceomarginata]